LSQSNLNRYYSPVVELVGIGFTALGVAMSYAAVALRFNGYVSFALTAAVFFAVAAIYAFVQVLSDWDSLRQNVVPNFFRIKLFISSVGALVSILLLLKMQCLPFMLNSESLWPSSISFMSVKAGLWLPLILFIAYLVVSRSLEGSFKSWLKAVLLAATAAALFLIAVPTQKLNLQTAMGVFAPCWMNVLVCAFLDRYKDYALKIPSILGSQGKFPMKSFLLINAAFFTVLVYNSVSVLFSGAGLVLYFVSLLILVFFEHKFPLFAKRWLPDLLLFTAFL
jgi:hypothetical protein